MSGYHDMKISIQTETPLSVTPRAQQLAAAFDVPVQKRASLRWEGRIPIEEKDWSVGLIVGPSGAGKSTILKETWGKERQFKWQGASVVDDFPEQMGVQEIAEICSAVGFNTIPAWMRPYKVLSNGEQFRVRLARTLAESAHDKPIVMDEFTSVVDRQVARIGAYAAQKWVRRNGRQLIVATCHYDVIDWLQPDWILEPATMAFEWKEWERQPGFQQRPRVECEVCRVPYSYWRLFAPFHYMSADLNRAAQGYCLFVDGTPVAYAGVLHRPHGSTRRPLKGISRVVTHPDWQGLGLAFALMDRLGAAYTTIGCDLHMYPAHPPLIRAFDRSKTWTLRQKPGVINPIRSAVGETWEHGGRQCATFRYCGPGMDVETAELLVGREAHNVIKIRPGVGRASKRKAQGLPPTKPRAKQSANVTKLKRSLKATKRKTTNG